MLSIAVSVAPSSASSTRASSPWSSSSLSQSQTSKAKRTSSLSAAAERIALWRKDPVTFVRDCFRAEPDPWQTAALNAYAGSKRVALKACKGPGKSTALAWSIWHFLTVWPHPLVGGTSITGENLRDTLWTELARWRLRSPFHQTAFEWGPTRIVSRDHPDTWYATARTWSRAASPDEQGLTLAGLHADYALFVLDEAGGIPDAVATEAEGVLSTGTVTKLIIAGNPTHLTGPLYRACMLERPDWLVIQVTGDPDRADRAPRVDIEWARKMIRSYGRDSALVQAKVLGEFPSAATDALVSVQQFEDAFLRWGPDGLADSPRGLGLDVARYGADRNVLCYRAGDRVERFEAWQGQDTVYTAGRVAEAAEDWAAEFVHVDDVGVGGGVTDQLAAMDVRGVVGINVGAGATDKAKHLNLRSELNLGLQSRFREGLIAIEPSIRDQTTLMAEGTTLKVGYSTGSRRKIEGKDEYKKRTGMSPDYWDALVLAFDARGEMPLVEFG